MISGPFVPGPKPSVFRSYACRVIVSDGSLPASGKPSRMSSAGYASASSTSVATIAAGQGRRWTAWLQRAAGDSPRARSVRLRGRPRNGSRSRSTRGPRYDSSAGSSVTAPSITTSTASEAAIATPYMYGRPVRNRPITAITTVPPAMITLRPAVVTASWTASWRVLAVGQRGAEAGQHEQRVVDPDADPDQAGDRGRPVGHVDDVGEQQDQAAGGDAEAEQRDQERQAGRDHRAERDQQHDRGAEEAEPLRGGRLLRAVDRVAAELDLEPVAAVGLRRGDQLLAVLLGDVPAVDRQRQRGRADRALLGDPDRRGVADVVDRARLGEERVDALLDGRAVGAVGVLPDDVDLLAGVAGEALLGELARRLRLRARSVVVGVVLARQGATDADDDDRGCDPGQHHAAAAAIGEVCETGEESSHCAGLSSSLPPRPMWEDRSIDVRISAPAGGGYIECGAVTPSRPSERAMTRCVATQSASRNDSSPSGSAPTTRQSR